MTGDTHAASTTWALLIGPLTGSAAEHLYTSLTNAVTNSVGDVNNARNLISAGVLCEAHRDDVTNLTTSALKIWMRDQPNPAACTALAAALSINEHARTTALAAIKQPKPRGREKLQAWDAAMGKLR